MGLTTQGSMHDYQLLKEELHWYEGQKNWFELLEIYVDLGYKGIDKEFLIKRQKKIIILLRQVLI